MTFDAEVIVVGGGPAGSLGAALLAQSGRRVLLLDKSRFPRHKACSEYINPAGARILSELGLDGELDQIGADRLEGMVVATTGGNRFEVDFAAIDSDARALGLSRWRLDDLLLRFSRSAGTDVHEGAHVRRAIVESGAVLGVEATVDGTRLELRAPLTIGADGRHSVVRRSLGLTRELGWPRRTGLVAHYTGVRGLEGRGEIHVGPDGYAGLAPLESGLTNVALVAPSKALQRRNSRIESWFEERLNRLPGVRSRLADAQRVGSIRGVGPMSAMARRVAGDGFLLVGDAAGFVDPFTGDGIHQALRGVLLAAPVVCEALAAGDVRAHRLAPYEQAQRHQFLAKRRLSLLLQGFLASPHVFDYALNRLNRRKELAEPLISVLMDFEPAERVLAPAFLAHLLRP